MTAPSPVARVEPDGHQLYDGYRTLVTIGADPNASFWEVEVQPSGEEGGDPIDITTMWRNKWLGKHPQSLKESTPVSGVAAYAVDVFELLDAMINVPTTITVHMPDGSSLAQYGWLRSFTPQRNVRGTMPLADFVCEISNTDPTTGEEEDPVVTAAGT